jgi:hypothetical protein
MNLSLAGLLCFLEMPKEAFSNLLLTSGLLLGLPLLFQGILGAFRSSCADDRMKWHDVLGGFDGDAP